MQIQSFLEDKYQVLVSLLIAANALLFILLLSTLVDMSNLTRWSEFLKIFASVATVIAVIVAIQSLRIWRKENSIKVFIDFYRKFRNFRDDILDAAYSMNDYAKYNQDDSIKTVDHKSFIFEPDRHKAIFSNLDELTLLLKEIRLYDKKFCNFNSLHNAYIDFSVAFRLLMGTSFKINRANHKGITQKEREQQIIDYTKYCKEFELDEFLRLHQNVGTECEKIYAS